MLDNLQLMSGFRQIKDEFRTKFRITKPAHELALWFTYKNGELYVHDMEDHKTAMVIASLSKDIFTIHLIHSQMGVALVFRAFKEQNFAPQKHLNDLHKLAELFIFKIFK